MASEDLAARLRIIAESMPVGDIYVDDLHQAADALESYELAERECLEREAVTAERDEEAREDELFEEAQRVSRVDGLDWDRSRGLIYERAEANLAAPTNTSRAVMPERIDWPLIPWPSDYPDRASYHKAMVGWVKTVTRIQRLGDA